MPRSRNPNSVRAFESRVEVGGGGGLAYAGCCGRIAKGSYRSSSVGDGGCVERASGHSASTDADADRHTHTHSDGF